VNETSPGTLRDLAAHWEEQADIWQRGIGDNQNTRLYRACAEQLRAILAREAQGGETCQWESTEDGIWDTSCGRSWEFTVGGPSHNLVRYCFECGKRVAEAHPEKGAPQG